LVHDLASSCWHPFFSYSFALFLRLRV
jgi:hypothetical protein